MFILINCSIYGIHSTAKCSGLNVFCASFYFTDISHVPYYATNISTFQCRNIITHYRYVPDYNVKGSSKNTQFCSQTDSSVSIVTYSLETSPKKITIACYTAHHAVVIDHKHYLSEKY